MKLKNIFRNERKIWKEAKKEVIVDPITLGPFYSGQLIKGSFERTLPRYKFICNLVKDKTVVELGCGEGIGTYMISKVAKQVNAFDFDKDAIKSAENNFKRNNIKYYYDNFLDFKKNKNLGEYWFDSVVALDVIEHIKSKNEDKFMKLICSNLTKNGFCIIGTPNENMKRFASKGAEKGHINLYNCERLENLVGKYFHNVFTFGMCDELVFTGYKPMAQYIMAIGVNKK